MTLNEREWNLLTLTILVVLAMSGYLLAEHALQQRDLLMRRSRETQARIAERETLIAQSTLWEQRLHDLRESLPAYPEQQDVTTDLLNLLEQTASRHELILLRRDVERERRDGELFELTINCRWRGNLDALVYFLYDVQQQGVRLGVRQLSITPRGRGQLDGTMTIDGAYSRQPSPARSEPADGPPSA